jgi:hypothetical protein
MLLDSLFQVPGSAESLLPPLWAKAHRSQLPVGSPTLCHHGWHGTPSGGLGGDGACVYLPMTTVRQSDGNGAWTDDGDRSHDREGAWTAQNPGIN